MEKTYLDSYMEVSTSGSDGAMAEQLLDREDVRPMLQHMGGTAVTKRMDAPALGDVDLLLGLIVNLLGRGNRHGAFAILAKEEPLLRLISTIARLSQFGSCVMRNCLILRHRP